MNSEEYQELAKRTLSPEFHTELMHGNEVYFLLKALSSLGGWADDVKRALYHGKEGRLRTAPNHRLIETLEPVKDYLHGILGELTELAELSDNFLKKVFEEAPRDRVNEIEEEGDITWYQACRWRSLEVTAEEDIYPSNINKLARRYPNKYSQERNRNRDLASERESLEKDIKKL